MSDCVIWRGYCTPLGYGVRKHRGKNEYVHRLAYIASKGDIPAGMCVCHICDVRNCINPEHLFLGTQADNMADAVRKGRHAHSKLNPQKVKEIRWLATLGWTQKRIADEYGVKYQSISKILLGKIWTHVPDHFGF